LVNELQQLEQEKLKEANLQTEELNVSKSLDELLLFTTKTKKVEVYEELMFAKFVREIKVNSRQEIMLELRCGLSLKERMG